MKKTYNVEVDCANCAAKMEEAVKNTEGVKDATLSFMTLKLKVEFEEGADVDAVMQQAYKNCKVVDRLHVGMLILDTESIQKERAYDEETKKCIIPYHCFLGFAGGCIRCRCAVSTAVDLTIGVVSCAVSCDWI